MKRLRNSETVKKSKKYKYVYEHTMDGKIYWRAKVLPHSKICKTEREAALFVDKSLIQSGKKPVNILKVA